jgi:hypothetical protein
MQSSSARSFRIELCKKPDNLDHVLLPVKPYTCVICFKRIDAGEWHNHPPVSNRMAKTNKSKVIPIKSRCSCGLRISEH